MEGKELGILIFHNLARQWRHLRISKVLIIRTSVRFGRSRGIEISVIRGKIMEIQEDKVKARQRISSINSSSNKLEIMRRHPT